MFIHTSNKSSDRNQSTLWISAFFFFFQLIPRGLVFPLRLCGPTTVWQLDLKCATVYLGHMPEGSLPNSYKILKIFPYHRCFIFKHALDHSNYNNTRKDLFFSSMKWRKLFLFSAWLTLFQIIQVNALKRITVF